MDLFSTISMTLRYVEWRVRVEIFESSNAVGFNEEYQRCIDIHIAFYLEFASYRTLRKALTDDSNYVSRRKHGRQSS